MYFTMGWSSFFFFFCSSSSHSCGKPLLWKPKLDLFRSQSWSMWSLERAAVELWQELVLDIISAVDFLLTLSFLLSGDPGRLWAPLALSFLFSSLWCRDGFLPKLRNSIASWWGSSPYTFRTLVRSLEQARLCRRKQRGWQTCWWVHW